VAKLVLLALMVDLLVGDPELIPHPVRIMGRLISALEKGVRRTCRSGMGLRAGGVFIVLVVVLGSYYVTMVAVKLVTALNGYLGSALSVWLLSTTISAKGLHSHSAAVAVPLAGGDLDAARDKLALIVGRDTCQLDEREIIRGVVETVAENTVDGIVSPLFYGFLGGAPLAMAYRAVNTLDSMLGHRDACYLHLGWAAARLDDLANYIPARIAGLIMVLLSPFSRGGFSRTVKILKDNARKHPSPNSGIPEAAMAGMLGVRLGGANRYQGVVSPRPYLGSELYALSLPHVWETVFWMYAVTIVTAITGGVTCYLAGRW